LKKVVYNLRIGITGNKGYIKEIFLDNLNKTAIKSNVSNSYHEYLSVFKQIPINIKVFVTDNLESIIENFNDIQKLDLIIFTINLFNKNSLNSIDKNLLEEFNELFAFQGISVLVGLDIEQILNNSPSKSFKISRFKLEKITKDLNLIYCFEVFNKRKDINEIYNTLFNDFLLRFQYSNPELFDTAKEYGKWLIS